MRTDRPGSWLGRVDLLRCKLSEIRCTHSAQYQLDSQQTFWGRKLTGLLDFMRNHRNCSYKNRGGETELCDLLTHDSHSDSTEAL
jgi:hypothetical protein